MLSVEQEAVNTNFKVISLTQLGIKPESTAPKEDALTTQPSELSKHNYLSNISRHKVQLLKAKKVKATKSLFYLQAHHIQNNNRKKQIKFSLYQRYYAEECNKWPCLPTRLSVWATQPRRNVAAVSRW